MNLPMAPSPTPQPLLSLEDIPALQDEVRALARERNAVILAHNYQLPEIQDVADYVGDSLGLSRQAAASDAVSAMKCTPQKAMTPAAVAAACWLRPSESPT